MSKIKIMYFLPTFGTGGAERLVVDLCRYLDPERFETSVCVLATGSFEQEIRRMGKNFYQIDAPLGGGRVGKVKTFAARMSGLSAAARDFNADIIHTNFLSPLTHTYFLRRFTNLPFRWVHTEHNPPNASIYPARNVKLSRPLYRAVDRAVGINDAVSVYFRETLGIPPQKIKTIINGIPIEKFTGCDRDAKRRELGFSATDELVGIVASLRPVKNHATLIKAVALLVEAHPNLHLVMAGDGESRTELEALTDALQVRNHVHFLGTRMDAHEIMQILDVYCLPSTYEGLPLSILEAWAAGKPVAATNVRGIRDLVRHEETGLLATVDDPDALAYAIDRILAQPELARRLADNGLALVKARYDATAMISSYEQMYVDLLKL